MITVARFAVPYVAVAVFWFWLRNAWLATLSYHALILLMVGGRISWPRLPPNRLHLAFALPALLVGPLVYALFPYVTHVQIADWLAERHFSTSMLLPFLPYFGVIHPWLEQSYWKPLREQTPLAHPLFAGYHLLVLASLTTWPWLVISFFALTFVSYIWMKLTAHTKSLVPAYCSHAVADIGIVVVAWMKA